MNKNILIFEDECVIRYSLQQNLIKYGYNVTIFNLPLGGKNCSEIVKTVKDSDLVIMDVHLKDENGIDIYKKIQKCGFLLPVVFITGLNIQEIQNKIKNIDNCYFLIKPIEINDLLLTISTALTVGKDLPI